MKHLLLIVLLVIAGCDRKQEREQAEYFTAVKKQAEGYHSSDPERAYAAEAKFVGFVEGREKTGGFLARSGPELLVWEYARLAVISEYCGRKDEAADLLIKAEQCARKAYPNEPAARTSAAALREDMETMITNEKPPWMRK
jgi:hypothetical protein